MKMIVQVSLHILFAFLAGSFALAYSQETGNIYGTVVDAGSGDELPGVNLVLEGTVIGAGSRLDGSFEINALSPGVYTLVASIVGYKKQTIAVVVTAGETSSVQLEMQTSPIDIGAVLVEGERVYSAASSGAVRAFDIKVRPNRSTQDMLQMAPGLIIAQHAGGGKAEQIFLRGFDADHGTDVAIAVDGVPTNMVSHGHGQGYADLHYVIADVVEAVDVFKGPYFARFGNLATAGSIQFKTREHIPHNLVRFEGGAFNTARLTTMYQIPVSGDHQNAYIAGQFYHTDGPVDTPQDFERFNMFGKFHTHLSSNSKLSLTVDAFSSGWDASGQIPQRAVDQGVVDRFGSIDDLEGGATSRQNINLQYTLHGHNSSELIIQSYAARYNFKLFSNFTFFLDNPLEGDMIEQTDQREVFGLNGRYSFNHRIGNGMALTSLGGGYRGDDIGVALWQSPNRVRSNTLVDADVYERNLFLWVEEEFLISPEFRLMLGLRGDYFTFNVEDRLDIRGFSNGLPHASGVAQESILNPKLNAVFAPVPALDLFFNAGTGFHSNDARDVIIGRRIDQLSTVFERSGLTAAQIDDTLRALNLDPAQRGVQTLPRARGAEVGFRSRLAGRLNVAAAAWWLHLEREYVFIGDAGTTELSDPTTRLGLDLEARIQVLPWLWADADVNVSRGKVDGAPEGEDFIALAPELTSSGGLTMIHPSGVEGNVRFRHIADRPANGDNSVIARGYTIADIALSYHAGPIKLTGWLENLLDVEWNEAQFDTESRLRGESTSVSEIHFTPGNPRNVRLGMEYEF